MVQQPRRRTRPTGPGLTALDRLTQHLHPGGVDATPELVEQTSQLTEAGATRSPEHLVDPGQGSAGVQHRTAALPERGLLDRGPLIHANEPSGRV
ncbi:hypothetical protein [Pedococcus bigeumensis]|uniref:hypothetical protein n=1 Tax=Pedococcus bigeumensis TaxID=433644 RepID=UPI002FE92DC9